VIEREERPVSGLFGARHRPPDPDRPSQGLELTLSTLGGYDDNGFPEGTANEDIGVAARPASYLAFVNAALGYQHTKQLRTFAVNGGGYMNTYRNLGLKPGYGGQVDTSLAVPVGRRSRLSLSAQARTDPNYTLGAFSPLLPELGPGALPESNPANGFVERRTRAAAGSVDFYTAMSRRGSLGVGYRHNLTDYEDDFGDGQDQVASVSYQGEVGRVSRLRASYVYSEAHLRQRVSTILSHTADLGYVQQRRLSPTRTFSFAFGAGATTVSDFDSEAAASREEVLPSGYGSISLDLARTWSIGGDYRRSAQLLRGLTTETFVTDAAMARVVGFPNLRARFEFSVAYSHGREPFVLQSEYDSYAATTQLEYGLSRWAAVSATYNFFSYRLRDVTSLAPDFPSELAHNNFRVGVVLWLPLYGAFSDPAPRGGRE
jgi:hypothetical protein